MMEQDEQMLAEGDDAAAAAAVKISIAKERAGKRKRGRDKASSAGKKSSGPSEEEAAKAPGRTDVFGALQRVKHSVGDPVGEMSIDKAASTLMSVNKKGCLAQLSAGTRKGVLQVVVKVVEDKSTAIGWCYGFGLKAKEHLEVKPSSSMFSTKGLFMYRASNNYGYTGGVAKATKGPPRLKARTGDIVRITYMGSKSGGTMYFENLNSKQK